MFFGGSRATTVENRHHRARKHKSTTDTVDIVPTKSEGNFGLGSVRLKPGSDYRTVGLRWTCAGKDSAHAITGPKS